MEGQASQRQCRGRNMPPWLRADGSRVALDLQKLFDRRSGENSSSIARHRFGDMDAFYITARCNIPVNTVCAQITTIAGHLNRRSALHARQAQRERSSKPTEGKRRKYSYGRGCMAAPKTVL